MHRIFLLFAMLALLGAGPPETVGPSADTVNPETKAAALRLLQLMGTDQQMLQVIEMMRPIIAAPILAKVPGPDGQKMVDEIIMPELRQHIGGLLDLVADSYTKHFSAEEISELRTFYETPIGQKMVRERPAMMTETQQMGVIWARGILPEVLRDHADELAGIINRAQQKQVSPAAPTQR
jgi:hypothetical protein